MRRCDRRTFLQIGAAGAAVASGLSCSSTEGDKPVARPPWILWGSSQTIEHIHVANANPVQTQQLARVSYRRPESWRWLFSANIIETNSTGGALTVNWVMQVGIGRASVTIPNFDAYTFLFPLPGVPNQIFSANTTGPSRTTGVAPPVLSSVFDVVVAQDIQLSAKLSFGGMTNGSKTTIVLDAYFAPNFHARPDWFNREFNGEELNGT